MHSNTIKKNEIRETTLVLGGTDTKHYGRIANDAYRFTPIRAGPDDITRIHGVNERLAVDNYGEIIRFYGALLRRAAGPEAKETK